MAVGSSESVLLETIREMGDVARRASGDRSELASALATIRRTAQGVLERNGYVYGGRDAGLHWPVSAPPK